MKISGFTLRPLGVALLCSLAACGGGGGGGGDNGGGGTTPPPATSGTLTIKGDVQGLDSGSVTAYQGETRIGQASVDTTGSYSVVITYEKTRADQPVRLHATSNRHNRHVLATQLDAPTQLVSKAGSDKVLDLSESGLVRINEFSTARHVLLQRANQNQQFSTQAALTGKEQSLSAPAMSDLAVVAHMLTSGARTDSRLEATGQSDTLALMVNQDALVQWSKNLHVLRDGNNPLFDKHYINAVDAILLGASRALPHVFSAGNYFAEEFQLTLKTGDDALLVTDHGNDVARDNARWQREQFLLRVVPTHSHLLTPFQYYFRRKSEPVHGALYGEQDVRDMTFVKVSELAGEPVILNAIFPDDSSNLPYAATNLVLGETGFEPLNTGMFNGRSLYVRSPAPFVMGTGTTPDGQRSFLISTFEELKFHAGGFGEMPDVAGGLFDWTIHENSTLRLTTQSSAVGFRELDIRYCKLPRPGYRCAQIKSVGPLGQGTASRSLVVESGAPAFQPTEQKVLIRYSPSLMQPLSAEWYAFENNGTAVLYTTNDANRNGALESNEITRKSGTWFQQGGTVTLEFYKKIGSTGEYCLPTEGNCMKSREAHELRPVARSSDATPVLMTRLRRTNASNTIQSLLIHLRPATQPPIAL